MFIFDRRKEVFIFMAVLRVKGFLKVTRDKEVGRDKVEFFQYNTSQQPRT